MSKKQIAVVSDGRRLRSERSRQAIIDAMVEMIGEGNLVPTAQQVSERAGVGIRSVFRHFSDMESLFATLDEQRRSTYEAVFIGGDRQGSLDDRILHAVEQHAKGYEEFFNVILCTISQRWKYEVLRKSYARNQKGLRKDLDNWLPELQTLDSAQREAVDAVASFEMWHRLREHQGLDRQAAIAIIVGMLKSMVK